MSNYAANSFCPLFPGQHGLFASPDCKRIFAAAPLQQLDPNRADILLIPWRLFFFVPLAMNFPFCSQADAWSKFIPRKAGGGRYACTV
jgi:hypothetical protein